MKNITNEFHSILKQRNPQIKIHSILQNIPKPKTQFLIEANSIVSRTFSSMRDSLNKILYIYKIQTTILNSKPHYLSITRSTARDSDKREIENGLLAMIKSCLERITLLRRMLQESINAQDREHKMNLIFILESKLMETSQQLKNMQERSLELKSIRLDRVIVKPSIHPTTLDRDIPTLPLLDETQKRYLEQENMELQDKFATDLEQVEQATQSLAEIADLQSTLAFHLSAQQEMIHSIYNDAQESVQTMEKAHLQLVKTQKSFGEARLWVFIFLLIASGVLLFLDYYGS